MKQQSYWHERRIIKLGGLHEEDAIEECDILNAEGQRISFQSARRMATAAEFTLAANIDEFFTHVDPSLHSVSVFRDIFGNPFRPVAADPAWLTPTAVAIATAIYADRAFEQMPILADALEEAGCTNADVLLHCRSGDPHVRGCWGKF